MKTMEEKQKENPNEIMENGLTREQNEKIEKGSESLQGIVSLVVIGLSLYAMMMAFSAL
jgi:hypothetical protein